MSGPTPWQQIYNNVNTSTQTITTTTETVIATISGLASRQAGGPILLIGFAQFAVNASTTAATMRIRQDSVTGAQVGNSAAITATAGTASTDNQDIIVVDTPTGEYTGKTYVLTIQQTAAAANWNTTLAALVAIV